MNITIIVAMIMIMIALLCLRQVYIIYSMYVYIYIRNACMDIKILLLRNVKLNRPKSPHKIKNKTMFFEYIIYSLSAVF